MSRFRLHARIPPPGFFFAVAAVLLVCSVGAMYLMGTAALQSNQHLVVHREIIGSLERLGSALNASEASQRGFLLTDEAEYLEAFRQAQRELETELQNLDNFSRKKVISQTQVTEITRLARSKQAMLEETLELGRTGGIGSALAVVRSKPGKELMVTIRAHLLGMLAEELAGFDAAHRAANRATRARNASFIASACVNLAFLAWAYRQVSAEMRQRKAAEEQLRQSHADLESRVEQRTTDLAAANRELEAFGYSVSHDLRAPLRHVSSYIKLLDKTAGTRLDEQSRRYVHTIAEAAQRMGHLIDDLLILSRIGRASLAETKVSLSQLVEEARKDLGPEIGERSIEWQVGPLPEVRGDPNLLRSALLNLLSNAVKYTRPRAPARIEIGSRQEDGEVVCYVRDNGAGFDMRFVDKLFGVFQRLHDRNDFEGTGIGLASVRRIIQRHGGRTWAEGEVNRGATIYFTLPAERVA